MKIQFIERNQKLLMRGAKPVKSGGEGYILYGGRMTVRADLDLSLVW